MRWLYIENIEDISALSYGKWEETTKEKANALLPPLCSYSDYSGSSIEAANVKYLNEKVPGAISVYGYYGTEAVVIPKTLLTEELMEEIEGLDDYPVFDEDLMNEIEHEREEEAVEDLADDLKRSILKECSWLTVRQADSIEAMDLTKLVYTLMGRSNTYFEHETGGGVYVDIDRLVQALRPNDITLLKKGESRKKQRRKERSRIIRHNKRFKSQFRAVQRRRRLTGISKIRLKPSRIPRWDDPYNG